MCPILSHCELQKPLRHSTAKVVLTGLAWSSKGILSVEDLRVAGMQWAAEPGLLSWGTAKRVPEGSSCWGSYWIKRVEPLNNPEHLGHQLLDRR